MRELYQTLLVCVPLAGAVACVLLACIQLYRWRILRRAARQATTEPVHPAGLATTAPRPVHLPVVPDTRDSATPAPAGDGPVPHVGATESFGAELRALRNMEPAPELVSDIETELRWAVAWHNFEHDLQAEVSRIFAPALVWAECNTFDEVWELCCPPALVGAP